MLTMMVLVLLTFQLGESQGVDLVRSIFALHVGLAIQLHRLPHRGVKYGWDTGSHAH